jgi:hypothetical protein
MDADDFIDSTIANLKIVGMLQKNEKIRVYKGQISIDKGDGATQAIRRWLNRDSRDVTLIHLRNTVNNAVRIARALAYADTEKHQRRGAPVRPLWASKPTDDERDWTLKRLITEMQAAEIGLQNLRATYNADSSVIAAVDVLTDRLRMNSDELSRHLIAPSALPHHQGSAGAGGGGGEALGNDPCRWTRSPLADLPPDDDEGEASVHNSLVSRTTSRTTLTTVQ